MVPDGQKCGRADGRKKGMDGRTHGRHQSYIPPTSSGDNNMKLKYFLKALSRLDLRFVDSNPFRTLLRVRDKIM